MVLFIRQTSSRMIHCASSWYRSARIRIEAGSHFSFSSMGIRGAWSLLSKDPRRFGHPFTLNDGENTIIFLDGPSLLYYVAVTPTNLSSSGSAAEMFVSPSSIYEEATRFVTILSELMGPSGKIHVVMDGLSPKAKLPTQINRLKTQSIECDLIARSVSCNKKDFKCKILPLFAEAAMIEALEDVMVHNEKVQLHRPLYGEAETFIAQWLKCHTQLLLGQNIAIMSDDTDFLVYPSCPGLVPFSSLQFTTNTETGTCCCLTGYQYLRSKFLASFLPVNSEEQDSSIIMASVAVLAGCDYKLSAEKESMLQKVRTFIVQSDIGGLRRKQRNDPTGAAALTAILRFSAHYYTRTLQKANRTQIDTSSWLGMISGACDRGPGHEDRGKLFLEAQNDIHKIYFSTDCQSGSCPAHSFLWIDFIRLVEWRIIFCRPVPETWEGGNSKSMHRIQSKHKKPSCKKRPQNEVSDVLQEQTISGKEESQSRLPLCMSGYTDNASIWTLPHFCGVRKRIYSILKHITADPKSRHVVDSSHESTWSSSTLVVSEYLRSGTHRSIEFKKKDVPLGVETNADDTENIVAQLVRESSENVLSLFCVLGERMSSVQKMNMMPESDPHFMLVLASLLLPAKEALLLLVVGTSPQETPTFQFEKEFATDFTNDLSLVTVACFHATLAINASHYNATHDSSKGFSNFGLRIRELFRYDVAALIWQMIRQVGKLGGTPLLDETMMSLSSAEETLSAVFDRMESDYKDWQKGASHLWSIWYKIRVERNA